jgi:hypothetical protein
VTRSVRSPFFLANKKAAVLKRAFAHPQDSGVAIGPSLDQERQEALPQKLHFKRRAKSRKLT